MTNASAGRPAASTVVASLSIGVTLALGFLLLAIAAPTSAIQPGPALVPSASPPEQWAFGGNLSSSFSCTTTGCPGGNLSENQTLSMSWNFDLRWAVIYTQTNISPTQVEIEGQSALGVSVSFGFSICVSDPSCQVSSISLSLSGRTTSTGFTNVTDSTVNLTAGPGSPGPVAALAITNASSSNALNFSGNLAENIPGPSGISASGNFDVGGSEHSAIRFPSPFALVPSNPSPGDAWSSNGTYSASGSYVSGASIAATVNGTSESVSHWAPGSVASAGTLYMNGTDTGTSLLYDNYTAPPSSVTVQDIMLEFTGGNFSATDGWVLISTAVYNSLFSGLLGSTPAVAPVEASGSTTSNLTSSLTSTESTYFEHGHGFVGASEAGNTSGLLSSEPGGPKIDLSAGPEPVSVAEQQYAAITASPGASGFPLLLVLAAAVVAVVVVAGVLLVRARASARRPPTPPVPPGPPVQ